MKTKFITAIAIALLSPALTSASEDAVQQRPGWKGTSLEKLVGKWEITATFLDFADPSIQHVEHAVYVVRPDRELAPGNNWLVGIWTGRRTDGSAPFNQRFHHRADPRTKALSMVEFGDMGEDQGPSIIRTGTDLGDGAVAWRGVFGGSPFVETWRVTGNRISFEALVPDTGGARIAWGEGRRVSH